MKPAGRPDTLADRADTFPRSLGVEMEDFWGRVYGFMAHGERNADTTATTTMVDFGDTVLFLLLHGDGSCERKTPSRTGSQGGKEPALDGVLLATRRGRRGSKNNGRHKDAFLHIILIVGESPSPNPNSTPFSSTSVCRASVK